MVPLCACSTRVAEQNRCKALKRHRKLKPELVARNTRRAWVARRAISQRWIWLPRPDSLQGKPNEAF